MPDYYSTMEITVIGLGKLGLPLAALFANSDHKVRGFDSSHGLRESLNTESFESNEPQLSELLTSSKPNLKICESIEDAVQDSEAVFIIVPTPSLPSGHFSNEYVLSVIESMGPALIKTKNKIVIDIVSTVMPGSCAGSIWNALEKSSNSKIGEKVGLCYNPEFIALGSVIKDMQYPDMHLLGESHNWAGDVIENALTSVVKKQVPCQRMNLTEAELVKIAINNFVTMKISYANSLYQAAEKIMGIDIDRVTNAIGFDSRIGNKYLKGAAPYGGPCFPRDTRALAALYRELEISQALPVATEQVNLSHVEFIKNYVVRNIRESKKVGVVGISYKPGTPVIEESPGVAIVNALLDQGLDVTTWDDEGAIVAINNSTKAQAQSSLEMLLANVDFVVVTRPLDESAQILKKISQSGKPWLDLWRQKY
jgi:UDPglucose 6-dehydrogenase